MKKFLSYILIVFVFANFLAPISIGISRENHKIAIRKNIASAENLLETKETEADDGYLNIKLTTSYTKDTITVNVEAVFPYVAGVTDVNKAYVFLFDEKDYPASELKNGEVVSIKDPTEKPKPIEKVNVTLQDFLTDEEKNLTEGELKEKRLADGYIKKTGKAVFSGLSSDTLYFINGLATQKDFGIMSFLNPYAALYNATAGKASSGITTPIAIAIKTLSADNNSEAIGGSAQTNNSPDPMPACNLLNGALGGEGTFMGCIAQMFYYILFVPTSYVFALTGNIFDWIFAYSVDDDSYRSAFVVQGWGVLRDVCNIFFIFILLYIAFKTILNLKSGKTKELVVNVVIIGLFINFSLFTTRIIIDTSNILARVFYNSNTIQTTEGGSNGVTDVRADNNTTSSSSDSGVIPLSAGLVNKVNPQNLIINANKAVDHSSNVKSNGASNVDSTEGSEARITAGNFIIITILASIVNIVGIIVFISVAIFFVARVVGLWIMMIVSPLAFMSYAIPESQNISQIGWKKWWPETINLAFMAPVFIFFLYIILQFLETGLGVMEAGSGEKTGIAWVVGISVPFIFIMVLLNKAKDIAKKMSGELGQQIAAAASKAVSAVGGVALGAATGGAALAMRGTLGKAAGNLANSESLKETASKGGIRGFMASKALKAGELGSKTSFDVRNSKLGQKAGKEFNKQTGLSLSAGTGKTGGYVADVDRQVKKNDERAKRIEMSGVSADEQDKKAKDWNDKYEKDMYAARLEADKKGKKFEEKDFKENYIKNNPKIETSAEINKRRLTERRDAMESGEIKTGLIPNKQVKTMAIKNLENKIGPEKDDISNKERYELESNKVKIEKEQAETVSKKLENDKNMRKVATENNLPSIRDVNKKHVEKSIKQRQNKVDNYNLETDRIRNEIKNFKGQDNGKTLAEAEKEYNKALKEQKDILIEFERQVNAGNTPSPDLESKNLANEIRLKKAEEQKKISKLKEDYVNKQNEIRKVQQEITELGSVIESRKNIDDLRKKQKEQINDIDDKLKQTP